jgi:hypothetical protein
VILTDQQRKLAEQLLISVINHESYIEYNELANRITPPMFHRQVGKEIGKVSELCHELGLPLLSAKVVSKGQLKAGAGFFELMKLLGRYDPNVPQKEQFRNELKAIRECAEWYRLADYLGLDLPFPRPNQEQETQDLASSVSHESVSWIFPCNVNTYDVVSAFSEFNTIDWRQSVKCRPGDTVYIYCGKPYQRLMYKTVVTKSYIPDAEANLQDDKYWVEDRGTRNPSKYGYARLTQVASYDGDALSIPLLLENGLAGVPQGPLKVPGDLQVYLDKYFVSEKCDLQYEDEVINATPHELIEGSVKQVTVNAYERNPIARKKCIAIHGAKCMICGFDFSVFYGKDFEGLIHVHHIKPLHTLGKEYIVNPETDLMPVCPNCHLALHSRGKDVYTPEELREIMKDAGK